MLICLPPASGLSFLGAYSIKADPQVTPNPYSSFPYPSSHSPYHPLGYQGSKKLAYLIKSKVHKKVAKANPADGAICPQGS